MARDNELAVLDIKKSPPRDFRPNLPRFSDIKPANTLVELREAFDPAAIMDPNSKLYVPRHELALQRLWSDLRERKTPFQGFLCGHRGSGKTTEFFRLLQDEELQQQYLMVYLTAQDFPVTPHFTEDALLLAIGYGLLEYGERIGLNSAFREKLIGWNRDIVDVYMKTEGVKAEAALKGNMLLALFSSALEARREWRTEERLQHKPRVQVLVQLLNQLSDELRAFTRKPLLVVLDDFEKFDTENFKEMYVRVFQDGYGTLVQPRFTALYSTPVFLRALSNLAIPGDQLYSFPATHLYSLEQKRENRPTLQRDNDGYQLISHFVRNRIQNPALLSETLLEELILIGGGLFRETARAIAEAARFASFRQATQIEADDVKRVFDTVKKDHQPRIRGEALKVLRQVLDSPVGWVDGVEPFLLSRLVVEYENGDLWVDVRYPLKAYLRSLLTERTP